MPCCGSLDLKFDALDSRTYFPASSAITSLGSRGGATMEERTRLGAPQSGVALQCKFSPLYGGGAVPSTGGGLAIAGGDVGCASIAVAAWPTGLASMAARVVAA